MLPQHVKTAPASRPPFIGSMGIAGAFVLSAMVPAAACGGSVLGRGSSSPSSDPDISHSPASSGQGDGESHSTGDGSPCLVIVGPVHAEAARVEAVRRAGLSVVVLGNTDASDAVLREVEAELGTARERYVAMEFTQAQTAIGHAAERLQDRWLDEAARSLLVRAYLLGAMIELAADREAAASQALERALALEPQLVLTDEEHPPALRRRLDDLREAQARRSRVALTVATQPPGAWVRLGSEELGASPVRATVQSGVHWLRVTAPGFRSVSRLVEVGEDGDDLSVNLVSLGPDETHRHVADAVAAGGDISSQEWQTWARLLQVAELIVISPESTGAAEKVAATWLSLQTGQRRVGDGADVATAIAAVMPSREDPAAARGSAESVDDGPWRNGGIHLRLAAGAGWATSRVERADSAPDLSGAGFAGHFELTIGGALGYGFVLGGLVGVIAGSHGATDDASTVGEEMSIDSSLMLGPVLLWFPFVEGGLSLLASVGGGGTAVERTEAETLRGPYLRFATAYEVRIARRWGLGLSLGLSLHRHGGAGGVTQGMLATSLDLVAAYD